jgi:hypothetical protein
MGGDAIAAAPAETSMNRVAGFSGPGGSLISAMNNEIERTL